MANQMKMDCEISGQDPLKIHPALKGYFGYAFKKAFLRYKHLQEQGLAPHKIYPPHVAILRILMLTPSLNQMTLGDELGVDKATMVKLIDQLEKLGLVRRLVDPKDRRGKLIENTTKGEKTFQKCAKTMKDVTDDFLSPLTKKEKELLQAMMLKLISSQKV